MAEFQIGVDASTMLALPDPDQGGLANKPQRIGGTQTSLGGSTTVQVIAVKQYCQLTWTILSDAQHDLIAPFYDGTNGPGPFVFFDAATGKQYTANVLDYDCSSPKSGTWNMSLTVQEV